MKISTFKLQESGRFVGKPCSIPLTCQIIVERRIVCKESEHKIDEADGQDEAVDDLVWVNALFLAPL